MQWAGAVWGSLDKIQAVKYFPDVPPWMWAHEWASVTFRSTECSFSSFPKDIGGRQMILRRPHVASMMGTDAHRDLGSAKFPHLSLNVIFFFLGNNNPFCMRHGCIFRLKMLLCACGIRDTSPAIPGRQLSLKRGRSQNCQSPEVSRTAGMGAPSLLLMDMVVIPQV